MTRSTWAFAATIVLVICGGIALDAQQPGTAACMFLSAFMCLVAAGVLSDAA